MNLIESAQAVLKNSYSPYSKFRVACAVKTKSGKVFTGVNVENASYGATVCAERVAIFNAVAAGEQSIVEAAIVTSSAAPVAPCGICRQVMNEFGPSMKVILASADGKTTETFVLSDLLPHAFGPKDLSD